MSNPITLQKLAELVGGQLSQGATDDVITGLNSITDAIPGEVTFLGNARYLPALKNTRASAALVQDGLDAQDARDGLALIRVKNPTLAFSTVIRWFEPPSPAITQGVHATAVVASDAVFDPQKVSIGAHVVIEEGVAIGDGTVIHSGVFVGRGVRMGTNCILHANAVIKERCVLGNRVILHSGSVIGSDGFGYEFVNGRYQKIDQVGIVQIDDDVEIGSCTTIDRARFGRTWIGEGSKLDNLVQIGHNCILGKNCIIVSQTGISGSTQLGDYVTMGGQVGVIGHLKIGDRVMFKARSVVTKSISEAGTYTGYPARPLMEGHKMLILPARIPELIERVRELEKKLAALEGDDTQS
ncbi:UDP-3-O-(3-hydroxymyristoyl)glucosamine N-acyltransferase [Prosthecobacter sp.]|uniref:UDP-3-O-(3-hydroxymyristoyl)glucosamine N-acyltransferase n=1 Tax=Prosthecobacter sp. TaxID=1965333 RepID=UPI002ABB10A7|nr:UDP-3-O-(3-hydroxymyristoyl)glucosamine N-acyltransferase [Prosthecobacter sp.]MDZ4402942.1 UDP-3-O-(3-hydroxymyristoyl)glucosamine N-acyltransferase [Prosthecobacter sp.]